MGSAAVLRLLPTKMESFISVCGRRLVRARDPVCEGLLKDRGNLGLQDFGKNGLYQVKLSFQVFLVYDVAGRAK